MQVLNRDYDKGPPQEINLSETFAIGCYAVTFDETDVFCEATNLG